MKTVGILQACDFILLEKCFEYFCSIVDELYVRFDNKNTSIEVKNHIQNHPKVKKCIEGDYTINGEIWREELLRLLDSVKPDIVIVLDIDEVFDGDIKSEIDLFWKSEKLAMMFSYNGCPTQNGGRTDIYPTAPHQMVFKWKPNLTYKNYKGSAMVTNYSSRLDKIAWYSSIKVDHFCMWTKDMEIAKKQHAIKTYGKL